MPEHVHLLVSEPMRGTLSGRVPHLSRAFGERWAGLDSAGKFEACGRVPPLGRARLQPCRTQHTRPALAAEVRRLRRHRRQPKERLPCSKNTLSPCHSERSEESPRSADPLGRQRPDEDSVRGTASGYALGESGPVALNVGFTPGWSSDFVPGAPSFARFWRKVGGADSAGKFKASAFCCNQTGVCYCYYGWRLGPPGSTFGPDPRLE
jgi:hypothetical protein